VHTDDSSFACCDCIIICDVRLVYIVESNRLSSNSDDELKSKSGEIEDKFTPVVLAERILSKGNLEHFFDALTQSTRLIANGCDFLDNILDLLSRHLPAPVCLPLSSMSDESLVSNKDSSEHMQVDTNDAVRAIDRSM
jgi:hypothetical protein